MLQIPNSAAKSLNRELNISLRHCITDTVKMKTLEELCYDVEGRDDSSWSTSAEYHSEGLQVDPKIFAEVMDLLIQRPNLNSSNLFRADILYDSTNRFEIITGKQVQSTPFSGEIEEQQAADDNPIPLPVKTPSFRGYDLRQEVVRRLIPRNPQLDRALEQSCYVYTAVDSPDATNDRDHQLVVYRPHVEAAEDLPWYHPQVKALAFCYERDRKTLSSSLSVHYKLFDTTTSEPIASRLHRTLLSLLQTVVRLTRYEKKPVPTQSQSPSQPQGPGKPSVRSRSVAPSALRDTILPQHVVQDTYARLKQIYARDLIARWVEKTEPSKHVFEDISIAAFLIELWRSMYDEDSFPGFIDLACGNGVLTYILTKEGFQGKGFDARRRKTWDVLDIDDHLEERVCIPKPFLECVTRKEEGQAVYLTELFPEAATAVNYTTTDTTTTTSAVLDGIFKPGTFIISNHADELTPWTPILSALSCPSSPLPFLAIPCCSHALSGARRRYAPKDIDVGIDINGERKEKDEENEEAEQCKSGDLRALRAQRQKAATHSDDKSQYACLTKKVVALAEEIGFDVEMTLLRIPSTRNIGVVGNRNVASTIVTGTRGAKNSENEEEAGDKKSTQEVLDKIAKLLERECAREGGVQSASDIWTAGVRKLVEPQGRGKVNLGGKQKASIPSIVESSR